MSSPVRFIETILPAGYIYELGVYLQTCAQIEFYASCAICKIEGLDRSNPAWQIRVDNLRLKATKELITELSNASRKLDQADPRKEYFSELPAWLHRFVDNRHIASHGRHYLKKGHNHVSIDIAPTKNRSERNISVLPQDANEAVNDADKILRSLVSFVDFDAPGF